MEVDYKSYKTEDFTCTKCGWKGKGEGLISGTFSETSFICDLDCPACGNLIGYWQPPETKTLKSPDIKQNNNQV